MEYIELYNKLSNSGYSIFVLVMIVFLFIAKNMESFFNVFKYYKSNQFKKLESAIACDYLSSELTALLKNELGNLHLQEATGIRSCQNLRVLLLEVYKQKKGDINLRHFRRSAEYLEIKDGQLKEKIGFLTKTWLAFQACCGALLILGFYLVLATYGYATYLGITFEFPSMIFLFPIIGFYFLWESTKFVSLKYVITAYNEWKLANSNGSIGLKEAA